MFTYRDIPNHFSFDDVYDKVIEGAPDKAVFAEVGTWLGASAAYMAAKIRESGKKIEFHAIDNFTAEGSQPALRAEAQQKYGGDFYLMFLDNLKKCGVAEMVRSLRCDSTEAASKFADGSLDFVYIDACHDYAKVKEDILAWLPKLNLRGVMAGHDYDETHWGVVRAVNEIFKSEDVVIMRHSWVYTKKTHGGSWWPGSKV